jgi:3'-5' exoribonuclease
LKCSDIKTLTDGTRVDVFLQCKSKSYRTVASGRGEIFAGELGDSSGSIKFIAFSGATINCKELDDSIELGEVVNVKGVKNTHEGFPQIVVSSRDGSSMRVADPEEYDLSIFVPQSNQDSTLMWNYITGLLDSIQDPFIKNLVMSFTADVDLMRKFKVYYGARLFHHSCVGGLLEHTWEVLQYCELACRIHPSLNRDLVYAGGFLHDVGVLRENSEPLGMSESKEGFMMGYVYLSSEIVSNKISLISGFPELTRTKLMNIILSHHERKEPDVIEFPRTPEAVVVACAEIFGSKVSQFVRAKKDSAGGNWKVQRAPVGWVFVE